MLSGFFICCPVTEFRPKQSAKEVTEDARSRLKDDSLENLDDLPPPDVLAQEIIEHLEAALLSFRDVAAGLAK